jgi:hypothetical protein
MSNLFPAMSRPASTSVLKKTLPILALGALFAAAPGCNRTSGSGAAKDDLSLVPREADVVVMVNLTQARETPLWKRAVEKLNADPKSKQEYDDFVKKCSFDPLKEIDSVFLAMPHNISEQKEFAVLLKGKFNPDTVVSCLKAVSKDKNEPVAETDYNGTKLYSASSKGQPAFLAALGKHGVALGGGEWIKHIVDLNSGKGQVQSAKENAALVDLIKRTRTSDTLWWAGLVPPSMVEKMGSNPQVAPIKTLKSVSGSVDPTKGLNLAAYLDLGSDPDADALKTLATNQIAQIKTMPAVQMMGMGPFIDTVKVDAKKNTFSLTINMTQPQVDDLTTRLAGMAKQFGM